MQASNIIELNGRGIPAILHSAKIVDVCAYLKSSGTPAALVLSDRGDVRGVLAEGDIIGAAGRLGSSVMQMMAGELMREQAPVCQSDTTIVEVLEVLGETASDFVLVTEAGVIKGLVTFQDVAELLTSALAGGDEAAADVAAAPEIAPQDLHADQQAVQQAPAQELVASAAVYTPEAQPAQLFTQPPEAPVAGAGQEGVQYAAFEQGQVAPAAHAEVAQPAPQIPEAAPVPQMPQAAPELHMPEAAPAPAAPAQQPVQAEAQPELAQPAAMAAPVAEAVAAPAPSPVSPPAATAMPTVSSLLQGQSAAAAPAPQVPAPEVPGANAYAPSAQPEQSSQAPISAAAAAARAIAARMQAPQAGFAAPGSPATEAQAPGASSRAGWTSFKAG